MPSAHMSKAEREEAVLVPGGERLGGGGVSGSHHTAVHLNHGSRLVVIHFTGRGEGQRVTLRESKSTPLVRQATKISFIPFWFCFN